MVLPSISCASCGFLPPNRRGNLGRRLEMGNVSPTLGFDSGKGDPQHHHVVFFQTTMGRGVHEQARARELDVRYAALCHVDGSNNHRTSMALKRFISDLALASLQRSIEEPCLALYMDLYILYLLPASCSAGLVPYTSVSHRPRPEAPMRNTQETQ